MSPLYADYTSLFLAHLPDILNSDVFISVSTVPFSSILFQLLFHLLFSIFHLPEATSLLCDSRSCLFPLLLCITRDPGTLIKMAPIPIFWKWYNGIVKISFVWRFMNEINHEPKWNSMQKTLNLMTLYCDSCKIICINRIMFKWWQKIWRYS